MAKIGQNAVKFPRLYAEARNGGETEYRRVPEPKINLILKIIIVARELNLMALCILNFRFRQGLFCL